MPDERCRCVSGRHEAFLVRVPDDPGDFAEPFVFLRPSRHRQIVDFAQVFDHCGEECVPRRSSQWRPLAQQFGLAFPRQVEYRPRQLVQVQPQQLASVHPLRKASAYSGSRVRPIVSDLRTV